MNNEREPLLQRGIFLRMYNIGHLFEFIHSLYSGKRFKLEKQCTERLAELSKVENSISPDILLIFSGLVICCVLLASSIFPVCL